MRYPSSYLFNHDIDWFCRVEGFYIHVASAGGWLPRHINDDEYLRNVQHRVAMMPDVYNDEDIVYNEQAIRNVLGRDVEIGKTYEEARTQYIESFTAMARKGFVSFDRTIITDPNDEHYHVVCYPRTYRDVMRNMNHEVVIYSDIIDGWGIIIPVEFYEVGEEEWVIGER